jgi:hypothetical protein
VVERLGSEPSEKLNRLQRTCDAILRNTTRKASEPAPTPTRRWADVAASAVQAEPPRPVIRARIPDTTDKTPSEILEIVRPAIPQAIAIYKLKSGDVDIRLTSQAQRDAVAAASDPQGIQILRKVYLIEIPGVLYIFPVRNSRVADNSEATQAIEKALQKIYRTIRIRSLRWL